MYICEHVMFSFVRVINVLVMCLLFTRVAQMEVATNFPFSQNKTVLSHLNI